MNDMSVLRLEPNFIYPTDCTDIELGYFGPQEGFISWRVYIDGQKIADSAHSFSPTDHLIELNISKCIPIAMDGSDYVSVRRAGDKIIWFAAREQHYVPQSPGLRSDELYVFDAIQYQQEIERQPVTMETHSLTSDTALPSITSNEIHEMLYHHFPDEDLALYRIPDHADDQTGKEIIRRTRLYLLENEYHTLAISEQPSEWVELRIGIDGLLQFYELQWLVGRTSQGLAVKFVSAPKFPVWLGGEAVDKAFGDIYISA